MGRTEYHRAVPDKRDRNDDEQKKRAENEERGKPEPIYSTKFSKDEISQEDRRPKRKVAVLIGYSGTGYHGMQIMPRQRTIEGDLFQAFVKAGAISKANADDPKKSALVRCARTDKGVHAAGNVISLKLIIEDEDIVEKINSHLPEQVRVWGIERATGGFSCYAACDSRWYEYLVPTYSFLPPHPTSFMGKQLGELATEVGDLDGYNARQKEVSGFWEEVEATKIRPILDTLDDETRRTVEEAIYRTEGVTKGFFEDEVIGGAEEEEDDNPTENTASRSGKTKEIDQPAEQPNEPEAEQDDNADSMDVTIDPEGTNTPVDEETKKIRQPPIRSEPVEKAIKLIKAAYIEAKTAYRIQPERLARVQDVLARYEGTHNFHNFTIKKNPRDSSAKRYIKSFQVNGDPVLINGTEWLSLKVHGQSFMMHQIRKMVAMVALIVRTGCVPSRLADSMCLDVYNIPKAPSIGLLLERPVFDSYNKKAQGFGRDDITFDIHEKAMLEFKQREIYDKIFLEEDASHVFHTFFSQIDNFKMPYFLFLSSKGVNASKGTRDVSHHSQPSRRERKRGYEKANSSRRFGKKVAADGLDDKLIAGAESVPESTVTEEAKETVPQETKSTESAADKMES
ncbi:putative tRNA pseudouridine synthase [Microthyrium microscopicum]|uniref:tRNA pseudouridine synthase 1 n=1 Tax=Microthyrium microscopicum TaxID=703497 RepID=A0A6A6US35_9PEZI|nr:putative tRNA pseudouridine synthase [Microthyrium microscopicum]